MPVRFAALALVAASLAAGPAQAGERAFAAALGEFRALHRAETQQAGIAGSSFYFVRGGRTVAADHLGDQDADARVPVDARTISGSRTPMPGCRSTPTPSITGRRSPRR